MPLGVRFEVSNVHSRPSQSLFVSHCLCLSPSLPSLPFPSIPLSFFLSLSPSPSLPFTHLCLSACLLAEVQYISCKLSAPCLPATMNSATIILHQLKTLSNTQQLNASYHKGCLVMVSLHNTRTLPKLTALSLFSRKIILLYIIC